MPKKLGSNLGCPPKKVHQQSDKAIGRFIELSNLDECVFIESSLLVKDPPGSLSL